MRDAPKTRASLILRLRDRDDLNAWQEFAEIYQPLVFRLARSKGFQHSDSLDIAQEVLLRVANAVGRWDPDVRKGTFRGWLYRIARNLMIDFLHRGKRHPIAGGNSGMVQLIEQKIDAASEESQEFDIEFRRQVFAWAAERIQPAFTASTWQAFWETVVEARTPASVGRLLKMSTGAVYVARTRVMKRLREEVQRVIEEDRLDEVLS
ncbi:MAG: RNA polymerase sigma factor [Planctomycetaceae bacterium]